MSDLSPNDNVVQSIETQPSAMENAKNSVINNASAAANAVKDHPLTQNIANGPVAENVKNQHAKTQAEFSNLAASRTTPSAPAATGQPLTHYHSFFSNLLSWENPRASGIAFTTTVLFIFAARYLDVIRYIFKAASWVLTLAVGFEVLGKAVIGTGIATQLRPKKYYTISKETLSGLIGDVHELLNFFIIEAQQIVFAENLPISFAALVGSYFAYYMIKFVPIWGLSLMSTSVIFLGPLIYKMNQQLIDEQVAKTQEIVNQQTEQIKNLVGHHASRATESAKTFAGEYSNKAHEMMGRRSVSPAATAKPPNTAPVDVKENVPASLKQEDFPSAPQEAFKTAPPVESLAQSLKETPDEEKEPLLAL